MFCHCQTIFMTIIQGGQLFIKFFILDLNNHKFSTTNITMIVSFKGLESLKVSVNTFLIKCQINVVICNSLHKIIKQHNCF